MSENPVKSHRKNRKFARPGIWIRTFDKCSMRRSGVSIIQMDDC